MKPTHEQLEQERNELEHLLAIAIKALHEIEDCQSFEPDATKIVAANALSQLGWRAMGE